MRHYSICNSYIPAANMYSLQYTTCTICAPALFTVAVGAASFLRQRVRNRSLLVDSSRICAFTVCAGKVMVLQKCKVCILSFFFLRVEIQHTVKSSLLQKASCIDCVSFFFFLCAYRQSFAWSTEMRVHFLASSLFLLLHFLLALCRDIYCSHVH